MIPRLHPLAPLANCALDDRALLPAFSGLRHHSVVSDSVYSVCAQQFEDIPTMQTRTDQDLTSVGEFNFTSSPLTCRNILPYRSRFLLATGHFPHPPSLFLKCYLLQYPRYCKRGFTEGEGRRARGHGGFRPIVGENRMYGGAGECDPAGKSPAEFINAKQQGIRRKKEIHCCNCPSS